MSGGIDSSVAAALLKNAKHDLIGVTMNLQPRTDGENDGNGTGQNPISDTVTRAKEVATKLGIPHHVFDIQDIFYDKVIADFCREYTLGRTPNPCIRCNRFIKFGVLMEKSQEKGADFFATGHYARIQGDNKSGKYLLQKGTDATKDQSYFLCQLTQEQLGQALFPIGDLTKDRVKQIANELDFLSDNRAESQEICFIADDDYPRFLKNTLPESDQPGPIIDEKGNTIGQHQGIFAYTIGQRRGLGIAATKPLYVTAIEPERNAVVVGPKDKTYRREFRAHTINWIVPAPEQPILVKSRIRYRHPEAEATVIPFGDDTVQVLFQEPQMAVAPGQTVVFYNGDIIIGGGIIE